MTYLIKRLSVMLIFTAQVLLSNYSFAGQATPLAKDPVLEARLKAMSQELRCLVCQNSTLADSDAPLAEDLRKEIRTQMSAGKTDTEIVNYLVARYGDFVRFRPPVNNTTALLWFGPFMLLLVGAFMMFRVLKKHADDDNIQGEDA